MTGRKRITNCFAFACMVAFGSIVLTAQDKGIDPKGQSDYPRITCEELKKLIDTKATQDIVIVDNQPAESFDLGHIPGAVSFPWSDQIKPPVKLPRNKTLIMYCQCLDEEDSTDMADKLKEFGYLKIKLLEGGLFRWEELQYPIEKK